MAKSKKDKGTESTFIRLSKKQKNSTGFRQKETYNAFCLVTLDRVYLHNSPENFINTYQEIIKRNPFENEVKKQKKVVQEDLKLLDKEGKIMANKFWKKGMKTLVKYLNKTFNNFGSWFITPTKLTKPPKDYLWDKIQYFCDVFYDTSRAFFKKAWEAFEDFSIEPDSRYATEFNNLDKLYNEYHKLMLAWEYQQAYDLISKTMKRRRQLEGWLFELIMGKEISDKMYDGVMKIAEKEIDKILSPKVSVVGSEEKITDINILLGEETFGINLKLNDTSYSISRAMYFDKDATQDIIRQFYYLYYNMSNLAGAENQINLTPILEYLRLVFAYRGLHEIFVENNWWKKTVASGGLPLFVVFQNNFVSTYELMERYKKKIDKNEINFIDIKSTITNTKDPSWRSILTRILNIKDRYAGYVGFEKSMEENYLGLYEAVKELLPSVPKKASVTYTFYIDKRKVEK